MDSTSLQSFAKIVNQSIGVMTIGVLFSAMLFGITVLQLWMYLFGPASSTDRQYLKSLAVFVGLLDFAHLALVSHTVYHYTVVNFNNPAALGDVVWSSVIEAIPTAITTFIVQGFYAYRIWNLGNKIWGAKTSYGVTGLVTLIISATFACGITWVVKAIQCSTFVELKQISPITISINALSAGGDVYIVVAMISLLSGAKTGFKKSNKMVNRLMAFAVETGMWVPFGRSFTSECSLSTSFSITTCFAIASLVAVVVSPDSLIYSFFYFCIGRLYTNCLLAALNARDWLGAADRRAQTDTFMMNSRQPVHRNFTPVNATASLQVYIENTRDIVQDSGVKFKGEKDSFGSVEVDIAPRAV
ncbi:hypothetical protein C8J56DRAFT_1081803 [Mycena floridula]|nr:hypothetical protein C8J56DRAFT_1081803 [Mycena floridula]